MLPFLVACASPVDKDRTFDSPAPFDSQTDSEDSPVDTQPTDTLETGPTDTSPTDTAETGPTETAETGPTDTVDSTPPDTEDTAPPPAFAGVVEVSAVATASTHGTVENGRVGSIDNLLVGHDFTGDGVADPLLGSPFQDPGTVFVLGPPPSWTGDLEVDAVATILGEVELGFIPLGAVDATGDGLADVVAGDRYAGGSGAAYVFESPLAGSYAAVDAWMTVTSEEVDAELGEAVDAGDIDGDGLPEVIVGAAALGAGSVYALPVGSGSVDAAAGSVLSGVVTDDGFGDTVVVGDIDSDGYGDVLVGVPGDDAAGTDAGAIVGLPGGATGLSSAAWTFLGPAAGATAGTNSRGIAPPTDLDGSGLPDVAVAAYLVGAVAVFTDPAPGTYAWASAWMSIDDPASGAGSALGVGDVDGSGRVDLLVGCYHDPAYASGAGTVWLFADPGAGVVGRAEATAEIWTPDRDNYLGTAVGYDDGSLYLVASRRSERVTLGGTLYEVGPWGP